jgi:DNA-binding response OmpR family regulator
MTAVLVVDDEPMLARSLCRELSQHGFQAHASSTADEGLALMERYAIDVLVTDLRMRGASDGIALLEKTRHTSPHTRTILMSGHATARDYARAVELGAVHVLCKPFSTSELVDAVRQAAECESGFRGRLHGLSLIDVLQMLHFSRRPVRLIVDAPRPGTIDMKDGAIVGASCGEEVGELALAELLAQPTGVLTSDVLPATVRRTVHRDFQHVLLDALRIVDESRSAPQPPEAPVTVAMGSIAPADRDERGAAELLERGLELWRVRDIAGARVAWEQALALAPDNRIIQANLRRLSRLTTDAGRGEEP